MHSFVDVVANSLATRFYKIPPQATTELHVNSTNLLICIALDSLVWFVLPLLIVARVWKWLQQWFGSTSETSKNTVKLMGNVENEESPTTAVESNSRVSYKPENTVKMIQDAPIVIAKLDSKPKELHSQDLKKRNLKVTFDNHVQTFDEATKATKMDDLSSISLDSIDVDKVDAKDDSIDLFPLPTQNDSFVLPQSTRGTSTPAVAARALHRARTPLPNTPARTRIHANRLARQILEDLIDNAVWTSELGGMVSPVDTLPSKPLKQEIKVQRIDPLDVIDHDDLQVIDYKEWDNILGDSGPPVSELPPLPTAATSAQFRTRLEALKRVKRDHVEDYKSSTSLTTQTSSSSLNSRLSTGSEGRRLFYERTAHRDSGAGTRLSNLFEKAKRK